MQRGENMKDDGCTVCKKGLIEHIENRRSPDSPTSPFFWYNRLNELGKQAQTERLVYEAVSSFNAVDQYHLIAYSKNITITRTGVFSIVV